MSAAKQKSVRKYWELLEYVTVASRDQLQVLCHYLKDIFVQLLTDIAFNMLYNIKMPMSEAHRENLKKHKPVIRRLADRTTSNSKKRTLLRTHGHKFLPALVTPFVDGLTEQQSHPQKTDDN